MTERLALPAIPSGLTACPRCATPPLETLHSSALPFPAAPHLRCPRFARNASSSAAAARTPLFPSQLFQFHRAPGSPPLNSSSHALKPRSSTPASGHFPAADIFPAPDKMEIPIGTPPTSNYCTDSRTEDAANDLEFSLAACRWHSLRESFRLLPSPARYRVAAAAE